MPLSSLAPGRTGPASPSTPRIRSFARAAMTEVASVSAGPPCSGLYAETAVRGRVVGRRDDDAVGEHGAGRFARRMACETAGVGVQLSRSSTSTSTSFATRTSRADFQAGSDKPWVSRPRKSGPSNPWEALGSRRWPRRREDVVLVERRVEARAPVPRGAEPPARRGCRHPGAGRVGSDEPVDVDEVVVLGALTGAGWVIRSLPSRWASWDAAASGRRASRQGPG